jgi:hypothetical protein
LGLNLPVRFRASNGNLEPTFVAHQIRGLKLDSPYGLGLVPSGKNIVGSVRIYNYSFKDTVDFTYDILYQTATADNNNYVSDPDITKATLLLTNNVTAIPGREANKGDNWRDVSFLWHTPANNESGYLFVRINYGGAQLNVDNDWGYVSVAAYDSSILGSGAKSIQDRRALASDSTDLRIHDVVIRDGDGNIIEPDSIPQDAPIYIEGIVALDAEEAVLKGSHYVFLDLFLNGKSLVASRHEPYMKSNTKKVFHLRYDPTSHRDDRKLETLTLSARADAVYANADLDPTNHTRELRFAGADNPQSGGCSALGIGFGALALAGAALLRKKK